MIDSHFYKCLEDVAKVEGIYVLNLEPDDFYPFMDEEKYLIDMILPYDLTYDLLNPMLSMFKYRIKSSYPNKMLFSIQGGLMQAFGRSH